MMAVCAKIVKCLINIFNHVTWLCRISWGSGHTVIKSWLAFPRVRLNNNYFCFTLISIDYSVLVTHRTDSRICKIIIYDILQCTYFIIYSDIRAPEEFYFTRLSWQFERFFFLLLHRGKCPFSNGCARSKHTYYHHIIRACAWKCLN